MEIKDVEIAEMKDAVTMVVEMKDMGMDTDTDVGMIETN
jgi:hypothetical protein